MEQVPTLTEEQRQHNLAKAKAARARRKDVKRAVKAGELTVGEVISMAGSDEAISRMRVSQLLEAVPGCGPARACRAMAKAGVASGRRVGGLGCRQREALSAMFGEGSWRE